MDRELQRLFRLLARRPTRFTPRQVEADVYERRALAGSELGGPGGEADGRTRRRVLR